MKQVLDKDKMGYYQNLFDQYEGNYKKIVGCERSESWYTIGLGSGSFTSNSVWEGDTALVANAIDYVASGGQSCSMQFAYGSNGIDLSRFNNGEPSSVSDFIIFPCYINDKSRIKLDGSALIFYTSSSDWFNGLFIPSQTKTGHNYVAFRKNQFITIGSADWSKIRMVRTAARSSSTDPNYSISNYIIFDDIMLAKNLPNSSVSWTMIPDWQVGGGRWTIKGETGSKVLRQNLNYPDPFTGVSKDYYIVYNGQVWDDFEAKVKIKSYLPAGSQGLIFRADNINVTIPNNFYNFRFYSSGNIFFQKVINRSVVFTETNSTYSHSALGNYWLKVLAKGSSIKCYIARDNDANYDLLFDKQDVSLTKGFIGFDNNSCNGEYSNLQVRSVGDDCSVLLDDKPYIIREGTYVHEQPRAAKADLTITGKKSYADLGPSKNKWRFTVMATNDLAPIDGGSNSIPGVMYRDNLWTSYRKSGTASLLSYYSPDFENYNVHINNLVERIPDFSTNNIIDRSGKSYEIDVDVEEGD